MVPPWERALWSVGGTAAGVVSGLFYHNLFLLLDLFRTVRWDLANGVRCEDCFNFNVSLFGWVISG